MENPKIQNYDMGGILLGNNQFETGTLTLAAGGEIATGAFLARENDGKFSVVAATSGANAKTPVALYTGEPLANKDASNPKDFAIRAMIAGRVRAEKCNIAGSAPTDAEFDMLRVYGIVAVRVKELNQLDNQ